MSHAKKIRTFLSENQSISDCLGRGLVNYSSLARVICKEIGTTKFDAVLMSCRRLAKKPSFKKQRDNAIRALLRKAKVSIQTRMAVAIVEKPRSYDKIVALEEEVADEGGSISLVEGHEVWVLVVSDSCLWAVRNAFKGRILKVTEDLVQVTMTFPKKIENTPGVISYIYWLFAQQGINILEETSCWTDVMVLIEQKDMGLVTEVLQLME